MHDPTFSPTDQNLQLEVFFDGQCPMCAREINMLRGWDSENRIVFTDIAAEDFDPAPLGKSLTTLMEQIHARLFKIESARVETSKWIIGVDVFRQMYGQLGFKKSVWVSRMPGITQLLTLSYRIFAYFRFRLAAKRMARKKTSADSKQGQLCDLKTSR
jgi:predicted DCC family thiol-disulfide oxidoreductase YuxK